MIVRVGSLHPKKWPGIDGPPIGDEEKRLNRLGFRRLKKQEEDVGFSDQIVNVFTL